MTSVVVAAHNEARTIGRLLRGIVPVVADGVEVVVVCNGCTDGTADLVRMTFPAVQVVELADASKTAALQAGDDHCQTFPRFYLDADVEISAEGITALAQALEPGRLCAVAPTVRHETSGRPWLLRSHYSFSAQLGGVRSLHGTGAMGVTAGGRARFGRWPDVVADDYFLDGLFAADEKARHPGVVVVVHAPSGLRDLIDRKARIRAGNADLRRRGLRPRGEQASVLGPVGVLKADPRRVVHLPAHVLLTLAAEVVRRSARQPGWARDRSRDLA